MVAAGGWGEGSPATPLHVTVVTETFPPEVNGVAMTLGRMVQGLLARGHRVSLVRPRQHAADDMAGCPPRMATTPWCAACRYPATPASSSACRRRACCAACGARTGRTWCRSSTEGPLGASAIAAARDLGIPVVSEFHTNFHAYSRHYGFAWLEASSPLHLRRLHNRSRMTLVPSHQLGVDLVRRGYRGIRVVARGVDTRLFNPARRSDALRAAWKVAGDDLVVAHVGRLAPEKNLPLVLSTFDAIQRYAPRARLLLVGDGPAQETGAGRIPQHIFAGMRHGEDLAAHYASADLFLFPSMTETYGNVTLEALASGLPVVAYRMAAAAELIRHGDNGMLAAPGASDQFVRAALDLVTRPRRPPAGRRGRPAQRGDARLGTDPRSPGGRAARRHRPARRARRQDESTYRLPSRLMHVRSIFISDVHLGTRGCQAERLLDFLRDYESENLFLIGDIIDFWAMNRGIHWTPAQNTVVQKILRRARHGQQR
jgi:glycosyltransferase involved in cell wall biosynthesis